MRPLYHIGTLIPAEIIQYSMLNRLNYNTVESGLSQHLGTVKNC